MNVTVILFGWLEPALGKRRVELELAEGATVKDAVLNLGVDEVEYASTILDSERVSEDHPIKEGDVLYVFPPIAGGSPIKAPGH